MGKKGRRNGGQTHRKPKWQEADGLRVKQTERQAGWWTGRQIISQEDRGTKSQVDNQADDRRTDRQ